MIKIIFFSKYGKNITFTDDKEVDVKLITDQIHSKISAGKNFIILGKDDEIITIYNSEFIGFQVKKIITKSSNESSSIFENEEVDNILSNDEEIIDKEDIDFMKEEYEISDTEIVKNDIDDNNNNISDSVN